MTSSRDKLAIKVGNLAIKVNKLNNRVGGLDNRVDNVSKQVDEFSTKLEEFATNLTDFMKKTNTNSDNILTLVELFKKHALQVRDIEGEITGINESVDERFEKVDELSKKFKKVVDLVQRNSRHIERLSGKIKGKGKESVNSESKTINIKDVESEFKSISKTLEDFTNPQLTNVKNSYGPVFPGSLELSAKHTQDFKDLSEILKTLFTISKANSENITALKESIDKLSDDIGKYKNNIPEQVNHIPKEDVYRYFEFDKTWENLPEVKKFTDSKVVYGVFFNVTTVTPKVWNMSNLTHQKLDKYLDTLNSQAGSKIENQKTMDDAYPGTRYKTFIMPMSIKDAILEVEKFFKEPIDKSYEKLIDWVSTINSVNISFSEYLSKQTCKGYFLFCNKIMYLELDEKKAILSINIRC